MANRNTFGILLISGAVALSAVFVALVTTHFEQKDVQELGDAHLESVAAENRAGSGDASADPDGDGVPNWKEALFGTDPNNPDTDGDGVSDGEEIAQGSSATVFGTEPQEKSPYVAPSALAPSDALGRELFAAYLSLKQEGDLNNDNLSSAINDIVMRHAPDMGEGVGRYTKSDLSVSTDESAAARAAYRARVDAAIAKAEAIPEYEMQTVYNLIETSDLEHARTLIENAVVYQNVLEELVAMQVPASRATAHVNLVNAIDRLAYAVAKLGTSYTDPYTMLVAVNLFVESEKNLSSAFVAFNSLTPPKTP